MLARRRSARSRVRGLSEDLSFPPRFPRPASPFPLFPRPVSMSPLYASTVLNSFPRGYARFPEEHVRLMRWRRTLDDARVQQALDQSGEPREAAMVLGITVKCLVHAWHTHRLRESGLVRRHLPFLPPRRTDPYRSPPQSSLSLLSKTLCAYQEAYDDAALTNLPPSANADAHGFRTQRLGCGTRARAPC
jgi:hypothetical protein